MSLRDHPRACGEHTEAIQCVEYDRGSSPRLRGTLWWRAPACGSGGIIPALAGNMPRGVHASRCSRDHPRACGEHNVYALFGRKEMGSSPRLRGTFEPASVHCKRLGIIPALAGNILWSGWMRLACRDHPRACGEHLSRFTSIALSQGSSPRLRGTFADDFPITGRRGIIPALAGNIRPPTSSSAGTRDHPRACGEHSGFRRAHTMHTGSSPRLRGTY